MATELASGYIKLHVEYADAMRGVKRQFAGVENAAKTSGSRAGQQFTSAANNAAKGFNPAANLTTGKFTQAGKQSGTGFTTGFQSGTKNIDAGLSQSFQGVAVKAKGAGSKAGAAMATAVKGAAVSGVAAAAVGIGAVLTAGFSRLKGIDDAKAKLRGLGHEAQSVETIMNSALNAVKGTAFSLDQAASVAANAVAAGIKPGQELESYLRLTADAAAIAGVSMSEMGSIMNKVRTNSVAYTDDLQMLADRGVPIFQWLQEQYGVTGEELRKMVSDGAVSAADFEEAIATHIGGAALKMGDSFSGSLENLKAAVGRLGASLLGPLFEKLPGWLTTLTGWVDNLKAAFAGGGQKPEWLITLGDALKEVWNNIKGPLGETVKSWVATFKQWWPIIKMVAAALGAALLGAIKAIGVVLPVVLTLIRGTHAASRAAATSLKGAWGGVTAVFKTVKAVITGAFNAIGQVSNYVWTSVLQPMWNNFQTAMTVAGAGATALWQNAIEPAWNGIKAAFQTAWGVISPIFEQLKSAFQSTADFIKGVWSGVAGVVKAAFDGIISAIKGPVNALGRLLQKVPTSIGPVQIPGAQTARDLGNTLAGWRKGGTVSGPGGTDNVLAWLTAGEGVVTKAAMARGGAPLVAALNAGWTPSVEMLKAMLPGFARGGVVDAAIKFAQDAGDGRAYVYGGTGPGYDCSGYMSSIYAKLTGQDPSKRYFTTESDFEALGFKPGYMPGAFNVGIKRGGGGRLSHMAGTLPDGTNVESGGSHNSTLYGGAAAGAQDFPLQYYLPVGGGDPTDEPTATPDTAHGGIGGGTAGGGTGGGGGGTTDTGTSGGGGSSNPYRKIAEGISEILPDFAGLADIGVGGLTETLLPEGFSNPFEWSSMKSLGGLFGFLGGISPDPATRAVFGMLGAGVTGSGSGMVDAIKGVIPEPFGSLSSVFPGEEGGNVPSPYTPGNIALNPQGPPPGPVDNSIHIGENGTVGQDPNQVRTTMRREQIMRSRSHLGTARI